MALDVAILGENGEPEVGVAVGIDAHFALMKAARFAGLTLLGRMSEYYEDATFEAAGDYAARLGPDLPARIRSALRG
jgi:hypothetical protein